MPSAIAFIDAVMLLSGSPRPDVCGPCDFGCAHYNKSRSDRSARSIIKRVGVPTHRNPESNEFGNDRVTMRFRIIASFKPSLIPPPGRRHFSMRLPARQKRSLDWCKYETGELPSTPCKVVAHSTSSQPMTVAVGRSCTISKADSARKGCNPVTGENFA